jgi:hypothetical protein
MAGARMAAFIERLKINANYSEGMKDMRALGPCGLILGRLTRHSVVTPGGMSYAKDRPVKTSNHQLSARQRLKQALDVLELWHAGGYIKLVLDPAP